MKKLTETIVKRPIAALIIISAIIIFGFTSLSSMPQELYPDLSWPFLVIMTPYPGAGPEDVERLVTRPVEESAATLSGVRNISSTSSENMSTVIIQYDFGIDMNNAYSDVKTRLDAIASRLPDDSQTPLVIELDMSALPVMTLSVTSENKENLLAYVEDEIVPQIEQLFSVSQVDVSGGRESFVRVSIREEALNQFGISMRTVINAVSNVDYSAPLGQAGFGDMDIAVRTQIRYDSIDAMRNIPIPLGNGDVIRLSDVANIYMALQDEQSISRYNGQDNISINVYRRQSVSADRVSRDVTRIINGVTSSDPDVGIAVVSDDSDMISSSIMSIAQTLILAVVLAMLVLYLFMGDIRASLIVGSSMPVSLLITFIFMNSVGFSLNIISMLGLVLGVGMMTDNAIVVLDSCFKSGGKDKSFMQAAIDGTGFVMRSVIAVTLTTVVVFLPLGLTSGMIAQQFVPLALSVVFALIASLFSAITLVPLFFTQFKPIERKNAPATRIFKVLEHSYSKLLRVIIKKKKTVIAISIVFLVASVFLAGQLEWELMPAMDQGTISISVETKPGLKLERVDEIMTQVEQMVAAHPDVEQYTVTAGGGGGISLFGGGGGSNRVMAYLYDNRRMSTTQIVDQWRLETRNFADGDLDISAVTGGGGGADGVEVRLAADDFDNLREAVAQTVALMEQHTDIVRVSSTVDNPSPQAEVVIDPLKAIAMNLTPELITSNIFTALNGNEAAEINIDGQKYSIRVEYPRDRYESVSDVMNMMVVSSTGASVPLREVASIEFSDMPHTIVREEGRYMATISGATLAGTRFAVQREIDESMTEITLPRGVATAVNTEAEMMAEELGPLGMAILTSVLLVFMVMAIQFESIRHSLMVMVCVPFAIVGSFTVLFLAGATLNMTSMLGFLVLVGAVVNNGILYVDVTNRYRETMDVESALILTGKTRLRPILMITLTTVLALLPLALGIGEGTELMQGTGMVVIGGLITSTFLSLLFLPTFYLIIDGNPEKREERKRRRREKRDKVIEQQNIDGRI